MRTCALIRAFASMRRFAPIRNTVCALLLGAAAAAAHAQLLGPTPYLSAADSPFATWTFDYFHLEDFEDGALNTPGVTASIGVVLGPGPQADSVDADDGAIDGSGAAGHSWFATGQGQTMEFTFDAGVLGDLPTYAGIAWTDVGFATPVSGFDDVTFEAFDAADVSLGVVGPVTLGDGNPDGGTAEDRFFGAIHAGGIHKIRITMATSTDWEVDHLQYGLATDCNGNGIPDATDIAMGTSIDCNTNNIPDECEIDFDGDGIPDDCDPDIDDDGVLNAADVCDYTPLSLPREYVEADGGVLGDLDGDCDVDIDDFRIMNQRFTGPN